MDRIKLMTEITQRMSNNELSPSEGWACLKVCASHMTEAERREDLRYTEGYLDAISFDKD